MSNIGSFLNINKSFYGFKTSSYKNNKNQSYVIDTCGNECDFIMKDRNVFHFIYIINVIFKFHMLYPMFINK